MTQERFGSPDELRLADIEIPGIEPDAVLIRVRAAGVNPYDWHMLRGDPKVARLFGVGLLRPKARVAGLDLAGRVERVGARVRGLSPGDEVLGFGRQGSFAEYALARGDLVVPRPPGLTVEHAAALPVAATTALRGIRDVGQVQPGQRVLVNGAAGGVGTFAVQIANALGAEVTGVCSPANVDLVHSLGAAHVIDYTRDDFTTAGPYDVILDNVGNRPLGQVRSALTPAGVLVMNAGGSPGEIFGAVAAMARVALVDRFVPQRLRVLPTALSGEELRAITALVEAGSLTPVLERTYPLPDAAAAVRRVEAGHVRGKIVLTVP